MSRSSLTARTPRSSPPSRDLLLLLSGAHRLRRGTLPFELCDLDADMAPYFDGLFSSRPACPSMPSFVSRSSCPLSECLITPFPLIPTPTSSAAHRTGKHRVASARLIECPSEETRDDVQSSTHLPAVDLVVPNKVPLTEAGWDRVDEAVNEIDGGWSKVEKDVAEGTPSRKILLCECDLVSLRAWR